MAEYVFKDMVKKKGLEKQFSIASAATSYEEIGNDMHYGTKDKLDEEGIPYAKHKARRIEKQDYEKYDYIIGMEESNIRNILRIDRKSTRLNSSHVSISYAVFCLKKKKKNIHKT